MYIIYMILSLLGITAPFATNEATHGEKEQVDVSKVMTDMMRDYHGRSESICLSQSPTDIANCQGGLVKQDSLPGSKATYGTGVVSLSDGKNNVVTFIPKSQDYRFNPNTVKGDVYNRLNNITGQALNTGYYDASLNSIIMKDGSIVSLPQGMAGYQLYDHMPVLLTNLKGSQAATARGDNSIVASNTTVMDALRSGAKKFDQQQQLYEQQAANYTCADGSIGSTLGNSIMCGTGTKNTTGNGQDSANAISGYGSSVGEVALANTNSGGGNQTADPSAQYADKDDGVYAVNYSNDYTMRMGNSANTAQGNQAGSDAQNNKDSDDSDDGVSVNAGDHVPMTGTYLNNCQNVVYPQADPSASTLNNLGYTYQYDYYVDLDNCNTWIRPALDKEVNNYAVTPTDTISQTLGWGANTHDYEWFDWFGSDLEGFGVRNPNSSRWNLTSTDCGLNAGYNLYNGPTYSDLETVIEQDKEGQLSQALIDCSRAGTGNTNGAYGGDNGYNLSEANSLITQGINGSFGNTGPYFNQQFTYWGMNWMCKPSSKDTSGPYLHYQVICAPTLNVNQQTNDYTTYSVWKNFVGNGDYPYGGLYSFGHKGSTNLGGMILGNSMSLTANNPNIQAGQDVNFGISSTGTDYTGQAFANAYPFAIQTNTPATGTDAVTSVLRNTNSGVTCNAVNAANISSTPIPTGNCNALMDGIPFAFNREFFDFEQNLLKNISTQMSQNGWASATSTFDGSSITGTAGYPAQDSDGVWRWHVAPLTAPSFAAPNGTLLNSSSQSSDIAQGDYFVVQGEVPATQNGIYTASNATITDSSGVPSDIDWVSGGATINGASTQSPASITTNGYNYTCEMGTYEGYDQSTGNLKYSMNCTINSAPPRLCDVSQMKTFISLLQNSIRSLPTDQSVFGAELNSFNNYKELQEARSNAGFSSSSSINVDNDIYIAQQIESVINSPNYNSYISALHSSYMQIQSIESQAEMSTTNCSQYNAQAQSAFENSIQAGSGINQSIFTESLQLGQDLQSVQNSSTQNYNFTSIDNSSCSYDNNILAYILMNDDGGYDTSSGASLSSSFNGYALSMPVVSSAYSGYNSVIYPCYIEEAPSYLSGYPNPGYITSIILNNTRNNDKSMAFDLPYLAQYAQGSSTITCDIAMVFSSDHITCLSTQIFTPYGNLDTYRDDDSNADNSASGVPSRYAYDDDYGFDPHEDIWKEVYNIETNNGAISYIPSIYSTKFDPSEYLGMYNMSNSSYVRQPDPNGFDDQQILYEDILDGEESADFMGGVNGVVSTREYGANVYNYKAIDSMLEKYSGWNKMNYYIQAYKYTFPLNDGANSAMDFIKASDYSTNSLNIPSGYIVGQFDALGNSITCDNDTITTSAQCIYGYGWALGTEMRKAGGLYINSAQGEGNFSSKGGSNFQLGRDSWIIVDGGHQNFDKLTLNDPLVPTNSKQISTGHVVWDAQQKSDGSWAYYLTSNPVYATDDSYITITNPRTLRSVTQDGKETTNVISVNRSAIATVDGVAQTPY